MKLKEHKKAIAADLYMGENNLIATSSETGYGKDEILSKIAQILDVCRSAEQELKTEENEEI